MKFYFPAVCFVFAVVGDAIDAACHCNTTDACALFPNTPCSQPGNPDMCEEGWFGPYCQKQNVALGRPCNQSSTYMANAFWTDDQDHYFRAKYAVDGRATKKNREKPLTCSHTDADKEPSWTVYLNTSSSDKIQNIRLYLRERELGRNKGMAIFVGSQMCYDWSPNEHPPSEADVTCRKPLAGNSVTIRLPGGQDTTLTLCEVQIFVCSDGYYGVNCASQCGHCLNGNACDKTTGTCPRGCESGWTTDRCRSSCTDGSYGINCASKCGHCLNGVACEKTTGICPRGCESGWTSDMCQSSCTDGSYGINCASKCGHCLNGVACDKTTGICPRGCESGWTSDMCQSSCTDGSYGINCASKCGHCLNGVACDKTTGICPRGCESGWTSDMCQSSCTDGSYGINCASKCGHCLNGVACDKTTGICPRGCESGWTSDMCQSSCGDGRYGHHCQSECGHCTGSLPCNKINGTCDHGCRPGFQGQFCKECVDGMYGDDCMSRCGLCKDVLKCDKSSGECLGGCLGAFKMPLCLELPSTSGWEVPVEATLASLLVFALIALLAGIIKNRRLKKQLNASQQKPEDNYTTPFETTMDPDEENMYENIDNTVL